jgi:hypothetical protein
VAIASPARAIEGLLCAAASSDEAWGDRAAVNLPALTVTVAEMLAALERAAGPNAGALIDWVPDPAVARIVTSWPVRIRTDRALRLGLAPDADIDSVIALHRAETATQSGLGFMSAMTHRGGADGREPVRDDRA